MVGVEKPLNAGIHQFQALFSCFNENPHMKEKLKVLITGAANGLGRSLALQFAAAGADLLLIDKDSRALDAVSDEIGLDGTPLPGICPLDLAEAGSSEYEQIGRILNTEFKGLDVLVHCAAEFQGLQPLDQQSPDDWRRCMQANLNAVWQLTTTCMTQLKQSEQGRVVFVLEDPEKTSAAYWGAYGVSKAALKSLSLMLSEELQNSRVRVLNYIPPPLRTALRARAYHAENPEVVADPSGSAETLIRLIISSYDAIAIEQGTKESSLPGAAE